jgi:hypothetical protein
MLVIDCSQNWSPPSQLLHPAQRAVAQRLCALARRVTRPTEGFGSFRPSTSLWSARFKELLPRSPSAAGDAVAVKLRPHLRAVPRRDGRQALWYHYGLSNKGWQPMRVEIQYCGQ